MSAVHLDLDILWPAIGKGCAHLNIWTLTRICWYTKIYIILKDCVSETCDGAKEIRMCFCQKQTESQNDFSIFLHYFWSPTIVLFQTMTTKSNFQHFKIESVVHSCKETAKKQTKTKTKTEELKWFLRGKKNLTGWFSSSSDVSEVSSSRNSTSDSPGAMGTMTVRLGLVM